MGHKSTALEDLQLHVMRLKERHGAYRDACSWHGPIADAFAELEREIERRAREERSAEWACADCGRPAPIHVFIGEAQWRYIRPKDRDGGGVLCLYCMCERLTNCGYEDGSLKGHVTWSNGPFSSFGVRPSEHHQREGTDDPS